MGDWLMRRRDLLAAGGLLAASSVLPRPAGAQEVFAPRPGAWRRYEVTTRLTLPAGGSAQASSGTTCAMSHQVSKGLGEAETM